MVPRIPSAMLNTAHPHAWNIDAVICTRIPARHGTFVRIPASTVGATGSTRTTPFGVPVVPELMTTIGPCFGKNGRRCCGI